MTAARVADMRECSGSLDGRSHGSEEGILC
jgi:hypothetical protein